MIQMKGNNSDYFLTVVFAMGLNILPLPAAINIANPDWVLLVLIYWNMATPEKLGVFNAWILGLFVDVLTGRLLGLHALVYALISYACLKFHKRLRQYPVAQQSLYVFFFLLFSQMLIFWIERIQSNIEMALSFWLPVLVGTLVWPLVYSALRFIRLSGRA